MRSQDRPLLGLLRFFLCCPLLLRGLQICVGDGHLGAGLPLLAGNGGAVELDEVRKEFDAVLPVEWMLADWIVPEPEHLQVRKATQVL